MDAREPKMGGVLFDRNERPGTIGCRQPSDLGERLSGATHPNHDIFAQMGSSAVPGYVARVDWAHPAAALYREGEDAVLLSDEGHAAGSRTLRGERHGVLGAHPESRLWIATRLGDVGNGYSPVLLGHCRRSQSRTALGVAGQYCLPLRVQAAEFPSVNEEDRFANDGGAEAVAVEAQAFRIQGLDGSGAWAGGTERGQVDPTLDVDHDDAADAGRGGARGSNVDWRSNVESRLRAVWVLGWFVLGFRRWREVRPGRGRRGFGWRVGRVARHGRASAWLWGGPLIRSGGLTGSQKEQPRREPSVKASHGERCATGCAGPTVWNPGRLANVSLTVHRGVESRESPRYPEVMTVRFSALALVLATACVPQPRAPAPTAPAPSEPDTVPEASSEPAVAEVPDLTVLADGTILVGETPAADPAAAADLAVARHDGASEIVVADHSQGSPPVMALTDELRRLGIQRVVVRFVDPQASSSDAVATPEPAGPVPVGDHPGSLPEVRVTNVGLHIGGGPNDADSKAPFQRAVEKHFDELRGCYRKVSRPTKGGVYGVDLRVPADGGHPTVQATRTSMGDQEFRDCVTQVFTKVTFEPPARGATVISYSVKFELHD